MTSRSRLHSALLALAVGIGTTFAAPTVEDYLLPNGDPIVGVYYYSWFHGDPYRHVAWTPEFRYDNVTNEAHIASVLKAMTDYGINQGSYSYWDNQGYLNTLGVHLRYLDELRKQGRPCYFSPYLEPNTVDKVFASPDAQQSNADFIATFLEKYGDHPNFCTVGGVPLINIYVTYYRPNESDADFRTFLEGKYGSIAGIRAAWQSPGYPEYAVANGDLPMRLDALMLKHAKPGTIAFADRQELRAQRLQQGWNAVVRRVRERTGKDTRYTGDVSRTIVSPTEYMKGLTGMSWYSFGYALTDPSRRPRLISEMGKYTGTTFLNTISPGYVDRQQRWGGGRVERTPYLYPFAWVKAIQSQPDGIMVLTHSEWFEGSIIDVTREYGRQEYETTELYSSIYRTAFRSLYAEKHRRKPVALVFNEWATYGIEANGKGLDHVYGYIKLLESLNLDFDIVPESVLSPELLEGRELVIVPNCGLSLAPGHNEILSNWAAKGGKLWADQSDWWRKLKLPGLLYVDTPFGLDAHDAFVASSDEGRMPTELCATFLKQLQTHARAAFADWQGQPDAAFEINSGPRLEADDTILLPVGNVLPWGAITNHRSTGWGLDKGYTHEDCQPWERHECSFRTRIDPEMPVAEVMAVDSDSGRFRTLPFWKNGQTILFEDKVKFQALYAIVQAPVRLQVPELALSPGQHCQVPIVVENLIDQAQICRVTLRPTPGLELVAPPAVLEPNGTTTVQAVLRVGTDYASGNRTVVWQTHCGDHVANWWRPVTVSLPACIGLRTGVVAGVQGEPVTREIALVNVGESEATHITVQFEGGTSRIPALAPGEESLVPIAFTVPKLTREENVPNVELTFDANGTNDGLISKSQVDGQTEPVSLAGRPAIQPVPNAEGQNQMIYLFAADDELPAGDYELEAEIDYFDAGSGSFRMEYDSNYGDDIGSRYRDSATVQLRGTNRWRTILLPLHRAKLAGRQNAGADLRINGRVAVGRVVLRGLQSADEGRTTRPLTVSYTQFGQPITRKLELGVLPLRPNATAGKTWSLNPYGTAVPAYGPRASQPTAGITCERKGDLIVLQNGEASAVWSEDGRLLSLRSTVTGADYAAFPGDAAAVLVEGRDGTKTYLSGGALAVDEESGQLTGAPAVRDLPGGGSLKIQDAWTFDRAWPHLRLTRTVTPIGKVDVQDFVPVCLRFDPTHFTQLHPLGVGFVKDDVKRGWLESWVSEGWYFLHGGNPRSTVHGIALRVDVPEGKLRRFRYGVMPADELPVTLLETPKDEFQVRLRGSRTPTEPVTVVVDIRLTPGASYETAREWAQLDATPPDILRNAEIRDGDPGSCQGVQTIVPRAPLYMFDVNTPPWSTELRGEE